MTNRRRGRCQPVWGLFNSNGSVAALLVALFNLCVATAVYLPFVILSNKAQSTIEQEESEEDIANALKF